MTGKSGDCIEELNKNGAIAFVPKGNSMWPFLKNGKQSVIVEKKQEKLRPMDVALFRRENGTSVLHRVVKTTDYGYIVCGDSLFQYEKVKEENVFGIMTGFYKGKRYVEANDKYYVESVKRWYKHEFLRKFYVKSFFFFNKIITFVKKIILKVIGKKPNKGENND